MRRPITRLTATVPVSLTAETSVSRLVTAALLTAVAYYAGAKLGLALTLPGEAVSTLWPPNAILLSALLLMPRRTWWVIILAAFPAHLAVELQGGVPFPMVACWFISNVSEAVIGAECMRLLVGEPLRFNTLRAGAVFVAGAGGVAAFLSSFLDAWFVGLNHWGTAGYWDVWRWRLFSNIIATLTIVPVAVTAGASIKALRSATRIRQAEAVVVAVDLVIASAWAFATPERDPATAMLMPYVPLPLLLWTALRFGPGGTSAASLTVASIAIWSAVHGLGLFAGEPAIGHTLPLQLFLLFTSVPLLILSTVLEEWRHSRNLLRRSERHLRDALDSANISTWEIDLRTATISWSTESARLLGIDAPEPGIPLADFYAALHEDDREEVSHEIAYAMRTQSHVRTEFRVISTSGSVRWVMAKGSVMRDEAERPTRLVGIFGSRTARRRAERALRKSAQRIALAATAGDLGFWHLNLKTRRRWMSDQALRIFGLEPGTKFGEVSFLDRFHPEDRERARAARNAMLTTGAPLDQELRIVLDDGSVRWVHVTAHVVKDHGGHPDEAVGVFVDITDRREAELEAEEQRRHLAHLSRVAAVAELSGAIAHELNQPLASITANAQAASRMIAKGTSVDPDELLAISRDIVDDSQRAGAVIQRIRGLMRNDPPTMEPLRLNELMDEVLAITRGEMLEHNVLVELAPGDETTYVLGDRVQLQQVLVNLIVNACDAMAAVAPGSRRLTIKSTTDAGVAKVSVSDTGHGIDAGQTERLFEPFVSSKAGGLGLGLAISRKIVAAHGGEIWADDTARDGATFHVTLPTVPEPALAPAEPRNPPRVHVTHRRFDPGSSRKGLVLLARAVREEARRLRDERHAVLERLRAERDQRRRRDAATGVSAPSESLPGATRGDATSAQMTDK